MFGEFGLSLCEGLAEFVVFVFLADEGFDCFDCSECL